MYIVHILIEIIKFVQPKENAPHKAGHYFSLVARGGIAYKKLGSIKSTAF